MSLFVVFEELTKRYESSSAPLRACVLRSKAEHTLMWYLRIWYLRSIWQRHTLIWPPEETED